MSMPAQQTGTSWKVTGQTEYTQVQQTGPPVAGVKVMFQTGQGHTGTVFVPYSRYNTQNVAAAVSAAAAQMDAVGQLSSGNSSQ